ncbi:MAG: tRNA (adenosine(37)-N6)-dimethylallyltransferase MiaA [Schwartzia sp.]|jgi:tRNA dimethylallyltransferase|nr:tRNA (adenosine(37)-N6)-dimethylallyltransferase MiaA [Schwartzia sp. (in: firmicutes)]MBQ1919076.1 tRNA (adenosine(37)-N6)-dimethylallyltransferase MiaA [Schwartzia sp. (in: firmicutes)]MBQ3864097.1 tRNA (adenosine(37)-N6)-dimethylallyltransferase MiaA [Schwartzia sp. (in: firmicutes)]MBQ5414443.1 tRNA (adenosine(37)-N6)-dimethylallyltransferase MiaA [Schwartzia sp. (in: firmicutes)]
MTEFKRERLIAVLGPTASGKTALSVALAKRLGTEIISGDSMLVYRGFDIGSAKPDEAERCGIRHWLLDILPPDAEFNVTDFQTEASKIITGLNEKGLIPVLAGGTGLYAKALLEGYDFNSFSGDDEYRVSLERLAEEHGKEYVHAMLEKVDPETAARLHVNDFRRVVRALEVWHLGREKISQKKEEGRLLYDAFVIGLRWERAVLYERINRRVDLMMEQGLVNEVRQLMAAGVSRTAQAMKGIGYKETAAYLDGECSLDEAVYEIKKATRHFAKRQLTWYRKMPYIHWFEADGKTTEELLQEILPKIEEFFAEKRIISNMNSL